MEIKRNGTQPSGKGPEEYFTGTVRVDPLFESPDPARLRARVGGVLRLSQVLDPHGTPILSGRP